MSTENALRAGTLGRQGAGDQARWSFDTQGYLLILVVALVLWTFGFIELLSGSTRDPEIFGLYSVSRLIMLVAYSSGYLVLLLLMIRASHSRWLSGAIAYIQNRGWMAVAVLALIAAAVWILMTVDSELGPSILKRLSWFPFVRVTMVGLLLLAGGLILFAGWGAGGSVPLWRKAVVGLLSALLVAEILFQVVVAAGWLPGPHHLTRGYIPHGRIYQNAEGSSYGLANNYGLHYPDFEFRPDSRRVLLLGDTFIQALQVEPEAHLGARLEAKVAENGSDSNLEVMAVGLPGFGPGLYLSDYHVGDAIQQFQPDEIVLFFHLANDFQYTDEATLSDVVYTVEADGSAVVHPESKEFLHSLTHFIVPAYRQNLDPLAALHSYLVTPALRPKSTPVQASTSDPFDIPSIRGVVLDGHDKGNDFWVIEQVGLVDATGNANFLFEQEPGPRAEESFAIAEGLLRQAHAAMVSEDVQFRIVTIPSFPSGFYDENEGGKWTAELGPYDLFGPEQELVDFAAEAGIPILPLGAYLQQSGLGVDEIQGLFFKGGTGHFTPQGHEFVADAMELCFFSAGEPAAECSSR